MINLVYPDDSYIFYKAFVNCNLIQNKTILNLKYRQKSLQIES